MITATTRRSMAMTIMMTTTIMRNMKIMQTKPHTLAITMATPTPMPG